MEVHCVNGILMFVFNGEPTSETLQKFKQEFIQNSKFVNTFFFDTRQLTLPSLKILWAFGSFMLSIRPSLRGKRTFVNASYRVKKFLNGFFRVFKPVTEIIWTELSSRDFLL